jgi:hypothetical protein
MEISVVNGALREYRYQGMWWRVGARLHWKAEVSGAAGIAATPAGTIEPAQRGAEDQAVRSAIEAYIETAEQASRDGREPHAPA